MESLHMGNGSPLRSTSIRLHSGTNTSNLGYRLPKRDWRDWFIMATVTGGVGYALYTLAKVKGSGFPHGLDEADGPRHSVTLSR